ncbi:MAG: DUF3798 domain-containing protein [Eubacteriales bacterium]|nr:DUF3798 domain-containing protein [Eubacteriales bacterium]
MLKRIALMLVVLSLVFNLAACGPDRDFAQAAGASTEDQKAASAEWKIGILTGTVSQNEEEYRAAEAVLAKYGAEHITLMAYPDKFMDEQDTTISNIVAMASDPATKAIIIVQGVPGTAAGIQKAREVNPELLFIVGSPGEDPALISRTADIVLATDELAMGSAIIKQAKKLGAKTFIQYSFPRHMSYVMYAARRDLFRENCAKEGLNFVEVDAPDPTGDAGLPGTQQFIIEDVPKQVEKYGQDTAFFSTNCGMQIPLIKMVVETGAIYPQACCPSPFHGFPAALEIEIPDQERGNVDYVIAEIRKHLAEKSMTGRLSTWPVPVNMVFIRAAADYCASYAQGEFTEKIDQARLEAAFSKQAGRELELNTLTESGNHYPNYFLVFFEFIDF